jgi:hypothetical protein
LGFDCSNALGDLVQLILFFSVEGLSVSKKTCEVSLSVFSLMPVDARDWEHIVLDVGSWDGITGRVGRKASRLSAKRQAETVRQTIDVHGIVVK